MGELMGTLKGKTVFITGGSRGIGLAIAKKIIDERCSQCHSSTPTDDVFKVAPSGAVFDSWQDIERWKARILVRSVESADMPFLNKTKMTDEERQRLKEVLN